MVKIYGVMGHPVSHSLSPVMHNAAFQCSEIDAEYRAFDVRPGDEGAFMKILRKENIWGLNITIPHKRTVMPFLNELDPIAVELEAVNLIYRENNEYKGTNVDWIGIKEPLGEVKGKKVLLLGAGGAAEAACRALRECETAIWNRTHEKAEKLAEKWGFKAVENPEEADPEIIINCTSVGMKNPDESPVKPELFQGVETAFDIVYGPEKRRFIRDAEEAGVPRTISGEEMLLHQGYATFEKWTGQKAPKEVMRAAVMSNLD